MEGRGRVRNSLIPHSASSSPPRGLRSSQVENSFSHLLNTSQRRRPPFHFPRGNRRPTSSVISRTEFKFSFGSGGLPPRKRIGVGDAHPHIPPAERDEEMQKGFKADSLRFSHLPKAPLATSPWKRPLSQSRQILPIRQHPVEPHLLPQRSQASGGLLPLPRNPRFPKLGAASPGRASPSSLRAGQSCPTFFTCVGLVGSGRSGVDCCVSAFGLRGPTGEKDGRLLSRWASRDHLIKLLCTAALRLVAESRQHGSHGSRGSFYPQLTETKERDGRAGAANQPGAGAGLPRSLGLDTNVRQRWGWR